jgi:serine/threonine protein phosphatase PrpC
MRISHTTDQNGRAENQDRASVVPKVMKEKKVIYIAVYDGMGGSDAGGMASQIAKEEMETWFEEEAESFCVDKISLADVRETIVSAVERTNQRVIRWKEEHNATLGSTMAAAVIVLDRDTESGEFAIFNIGDSRVYKFGARNMQITKDQTLAQREVDRGALSEEAARTDKRQHVLVQCLGYTQHPEPELFKGKVKRGDYILLCSDGLYNTQETKALAAVAKEENRSTKEKLQTMINTAKKNGEKDNITAILAEI